VLVPARDEADVIGETISRLLSQNYPRFEVIVLDDRSTDGTREQARQAAAGDSRFRVISGEPLPNGWLGKNWACHQLAGQAKGEILIFTDADVRWKSEALSAVIHLMDKTRADIPSPSGLPRRPGPGASDWWCP
jgi:chlorobactene glucosyltransferase